MEYQGRRAGMATSGRATGTRQGPAQDQTGKRSLHGSQPGSPPRSGARRYDTGTAEAMARLWAIPGAREFLPRDYTSCLINEQRRDAQAAPAAIKWQHGAKASRNQAACSMARTCSASQGSAMMPSDSG